MDNGVVIPTKDGVPHGGPVSPVLSNIYLDYVLDLWFWNYDEAARFRREMDERLAAFGLRVAPEKTALLNFDAPVPWAGRGVAGQMSEGAHRAPPTALNCCYAIESVITRERDCRSALERARSR